MRSSMVFVRLLAEKQKKRFIKYYILFTVYSFCYISIRSKHFLKNIEKYYSK